MGIIEKMDQRLSMMGDMMRATDTDLADTLAHASSAQYSAMVSRCLNCPAPKQCQDWLAEGHTHAQPPEFCPNADQLNNSSS